MNTSNSNTLLDIIKKYPFTIFSKLTAAEIQDVCEVLAVAYTTKAEVLPTLEEMVSFATENPEHLNATQALKKLSRELREFAKGPTNEEDSDREGDEEPSNKRKADTDLQEEVKKLKASVEMVLQLHQIQQAKERLSMQQVPYAQPTVSASAQQSSLFQEFSASNFGDILKKLTIDSEVNEYISKVFKPLATTNSTILVEYESIKATARSAMKILLRDPSCEEAKNLVKQSEDRGFQLLMEASNPKVAQELALLQSCPLWASNVDKVNTAYKLAKTRDTFHKNERTYANNNRESLQQVNLINKAYKKDDKGVFKEKFKKECYKCGSPDHLAYNCPWDNINKHPLIFLKSILPYKINYNLTLNSML